MGRQRLDQLLVELGHYNTRSRARDAITRGCVSIGGQVIAKSGFTGATSSDISINDPAKNFVSRAALKLIKGLSHFNLDPRKKTCLDIGASTGGFTQVLLEHGANHVYAVDVGHDQLSSRIAQNPNVTNLEGLNARELSSQHFDHPLEFVVSDVSFISLKLALPPALEIARPGTEALLLVKPQFEVGRERVGKAGLVPLKDGENVATELKDWLNCREGWHSLGLTKSPISGSDGNIEYLLAGRKDG